MESIISDILQQIRCAYDQVKFKSYKGCTLFADMGISLPISTCQRVLLVKWKKPISGMVLNCDGAYKRSTGVAGGGGAVRDASGNLYVAYSHFYVASSSIVAELRSLLDGLRLI